MRPNTNPPHSYGHKVLYIPWEFYAPLAEWVDRVKLCDDVWTTSRYAADGFSAFDFFAHPKVVYPRVDDKIYAAVGPKVDVGIPEGHVKLLFVGGTIWRKGIDVLLKAYARVFTAADNVCLVIKDMGASSFYRGQTHEAAIQQLMHSANAPRVIHINSELSEFEMAALFRSCDMLVHPYRAEGFGMPILEAMASGLPVIVTEGGPSDEFVDEGVHIKIPSVLTYGPNRAGDLPTLGPIQWFEPNVDALGEILRMAVAKIGPMKTIAQERANSVLDKRAWTAFDPREILPHTIC